MGSSGLNPFKSSGGGYFKNPLKAAKRIYRESENLSLGANVMNATGTNYVGKAIYGKEDAEEAAKDKAQDARAADRKAAASARAEAAAAYNSEVIAGKRRRKAGSVLSRSGAGVSDPVTSVLASASTYGKQTLGA